MAEILTKIAAQKKYAVKKKKKKEETQQENCKTKIQIGQNVWQETALSSFVGHKDYIWAMISDEKHVNKNDLK